MSYVHDVLRECLGLIGVVDAKILPEGWQLIYRHIRCGEEARELAKL